MPSDIASLASFGALFVLGFLVILVYAIGLKNFAFARRNRKRR